MKYLVYLAPPRVLSARLSVFGDDKPVLEKYLKLPHATLFRFFARHEQEDAMHDALVKLSANASSFTLVSQSIDLLHDVTVPDRFLLSLPFSAPPEVVALHKNVVAALLPLADTRTTDTEQKFAGEAFVPRITIGRSTPELFAAFDATKFAGESWVVDRLVIARKEHSGWRVLQEYMLS